MGSSWCQKTLGDVVELKRGYDLPKRQRQTGSVPLISSAGVSDSHSESKVKGPGVVTGRYGTIGEVFYTEDDFWPLNTTLYVRDFKGNHPKFIYYFLKTINYSQFNDKGAVPGINRNHLHMASVKVPECLETQKYIAYILGCLDTKITLNRQTNQTLEQMAQTLFKSWFVDFDPVFDNALLKAGIPTQEPSSNEDDQQLLVSFPEALRPKAKLRLNALRSKQQQGIPTQELSNEAFPSEFEFNEQLGWIPKGWKPVTLESLVTLIGGGTPKTSIDEYWHGDIPWFSVVDAPNDSDVFVIDTDKHVTQLGVDKSSTKILRSGTTIISARGTVGKCAYVARPMAMNQSCYGLNGVSGISDEFIYYLTRYQVSDLQKRGHGSVFNTITRDTFKSIELPFSGTQLTIEFSNVVSSLFDKILNNNYQNIKLTKLRDTLLPKLISGELKIPVPEQLVKEMA